MAERQPGCPCWICDERNARAAARAAGERYLRGRALGPLDGVPLLVQEQIAIAGMIRRLGHDQPTDGPAARDATLVARLRAEGAIILGQTSMTELGLSPIGVNPKRPPLRNPHHVERTAGADHGPRWRSRSGRPVPVGSDTAARYDSGGPAA